MKKLIIIYVALIAAIFSGLHIQKDPGYVLIAVGQWTVETPLWVAILALVISFLLLYAIALFFRKLSHLSYHWSHFKNSLRTKRSHNRTRQGLIAFSEGNWNLAESQLLKGLPASDTPLINYLAAARSAQEQGDSKRRDKYLREAERSMPDAKVAVLLTQAQLQLSDKQWEQAHATLCHLHSVVPKHPYVLKLLSNLYLELEDWQALEEILPKIKRSKLLTKEKLDKLTRDTYLGLIKINARKDGNKSLPELWKRIPKSLKHSIAVNRLYIESLIAKKEYTVAAQELKVALKQNWDDSLLNLFAQLAIDDKELLVKYFEQRLKNHPDSPALLFQTGKLCNELQLWGKAKEYLEKSANLCNNPETFFELGVLLQALNQDEEASIYFKKGLSHSLHGESNSRELLLFDDKR